MPSKPNTAETFGQLLYTIRLGLIKRAQRLMAKDGFDINYTQYRVLKQLNFCKSQTAKELARAVEHDGGALTRLLDRLQELGYIARSTNATDRRAVDLSLTKAGHDTLESVQRKIRHMAAGVLNELERDEQEQLLSLLQRVRNRLDSLE